MWYTIISEDVKDSLLLRVDTRQAHLTRIQELVATNRVLIAGPHPAIDSVEPGDEGFTGSLVVADFPSLVDARAWANADPYVSAGVYASVTVKPFKLVLP